MPNKEEEKVQKLPTPRRAENVLWYRDGDVNTAPCAAIVTDIEGPGRVKLTIFPANKFPEFMVGVRWVQDKSIPRASGTRQRSGGWEFSTNVTARKGIYKLWLDEKDRRKKAQERAEREDEDRTRLNRAMEMGLDPEFDDISVVDDEPPQEAQATTTVTTTD